MSQPALTTTNKQQRLGSFVRDHPVATYVVIAYAFSWIFWLVAIFNYENMLGQVAYFAGGFGPAVAAVVVTCLLGVTIRQWVHSLTFWRVKTHWYVVALGLPILIVWLTSAGFALLGNKLDLSLLPGRFAMYLPTLLFISLFNGGNEEPGWRGFALPRLEARYGPAVATLLLGVIWALWHIPLLAMGPSTSQGMPGVGEWTLRLSMSVLNIIGVAFLLTWIYNRTRSVLLALLMHGNINTANLLLIPLASNALTGAVSQAFQIVMNVTLLMAVIVVVVITRGRLGYQNSTKRSELVPSE